MSVIQRLQSLATHLSPVANGTSSRDKILQKSPDDVVIVYSARTPLTKARKGGLKDTPLDDLLITLLTASIPPEKSKSIHIANLDHKNIKESSKLDPTLVEDVCLGNVLHPGASYVLRASILAAGFPVTTAASVASRWCSSGLLATQQIANQILSGSIDCGIAIGAESMSINADTGAPSFSRNATHLPTGQEREKVHDMRMPMGWTAENVASDFAVSREMQDAFAAESQRKAEVAKKAGWSAKEIVPVTTTIKDRETGEEKRVTVTEDDGVRYGTTPEGLAKIKAAFPKWAPSTTTGGNASQVTDGAAALVLMRRSLADASGIPVLGKFVHATVVALEPRIMGIGPTYAIPKLLGKLDLKMEDVDIFEINEAFSSMGVYCREKLGIPAEKFNPRGGAVALGHPLGCTGARQIVTALSELQRTGKKIAVTSMCVGTGMGMAGCIVSEQ